MLNRRTCFVYIIALVSLLAGGRWVHAHHSSLLYENKRLVQVDGVVSKALFGNPHSRHTIRSGDAETWTMIAQVPEDARRFGYYDEPKALQQGDAVRIIGSSPMDRAVLDPRVRTAVAPAIAGESDASMLVGCSMTIQ